MATVSRTRTVAAAPRAVWELLADFGAIGAWAPGVDHSCLLEHGPAGPVGTSRRVQVGRDTLVERITDYQPPATLGYRVEGLPRRWGRITNCWRLRPAADDRTAVTLTSTVAIGGHPLAGVAERVVCRLLAGRSEAMLAGLADRMRGWTPMGGGA